MKGLIIIITLILQIGLIDAQNTSIKMENYFDFWKGEWEASWVENEVVSINGTNVISTILDGKVIQEHFKINSGNSKGFKGTSISVFNPKTKIWKQAWADNQGGYYDFTGNIDGNKRIFTTKIKEKDGNQNILRMVFYDKRKNSFIWDWEGSKDGGKTWSLKWRIYYKRVKKIND